MQMTNCFHYGQDCSDCDDSQGVPECFKSRNDTCSKCGRSFDIDVGCLCSEHGGDVDDDQGGSDGS